jgi:hypothetical protein
MVPLAEKAKRVKVQKPEAVRYCPREGCYRDHWLISHEMRCETFNWRFAYGDGVYWQTTRMTSSRMGQSRDLAFCAVGVRPGPF